MSYRRPCRSDIDLVESSRVVTRVPTVWSQPTRIVIELSGVAGGSGRAVGVLQLIQSGGSSVAIPGLFHDENRVAEFDLHQVEDGLFKPTITVWAPDGSVAPRAVKLSPVHVLGTSSAWTTSC